MAVFDSSVQLFARGRLVTACGYGGAGRCVCGPSIAAVGVSARTPGEAVAPCAWAHVVSTGALTTEGVPFAAWVRMAPTIHTLRVCEFHSARCCTQCYRGHMSCNGMVVLAAALVGFCAVVSALMREGWCSLDTLGARVYHCCGAITWWHIVWYMGFLVHTKSMELEVAVTCSRLLCAWESATLTISHRAWLLAA